MPVPRPAAPRPAAALLAVVVLVGALAAACVPPQAESSPSPTLAPTPTPSANPYDGVAAGAGKGVKIGYVSFGDLVPFVAEVSAGIRAQASLAGADLVECDARYDPNAVAGCMTQLSQAGVAGIIQFQGVLRDPAAVCAETPSGVPVVAVEFPQAPCAKTLVAADDLRAGQIAGRAVGEWVKAKWSCTYDAFVSFESDTSAPDRNQRRMEGYRQGFTAVCPGQITNLQVGRSVDTEAAAKSAMTTVLGGMSGKSRIVVVAVNDDAALGAIEAASAAGRPGDVWVSGQGADERARAQIRANEHWIGDAAYFPERYGMTIVPALLDLIAGRTVPAELLVEPAWVDASNIDTVYPQ